MSLYYPSTQPVIAPNIMVRKARRLPVGGDILVRIGARVEPDDVVARAHIPGAPRQVPVAGPLGAAPQNAERYLSKKIGATVEAGDVVAARRVGLGNRVVVRSPVAGTLTAYDAQTGAAVITPPGTDFELPAHLNGVVTEHIPYRGVVIDTPAALVRGIAGVGGEQHGVLQVAVADPGEELLPERVTARLAYGVVLGGGTTTAAALQRAVEHRVRAVLVGSIPESELRAFLGYREGLRGWTLGCAGWDFPPPPAAGAPSWPDLTVIIVEGFGRVPMTARAWELLAAHDGQPVAVDGTTRLRGALARPEIIVPLPRARGTAPFETTAPPLAAHSIVRLLAPAYLGQVGRVLSLSQGKQALESGLSAPAAQVQLPSGHELWVPIPNLEVLE